MSVNEVLSNGALKKISGLGASGLGIKSVNINSNNHLIVTYDDNTTHDAGEIEGGSGTGDMDASTYDPNGDVATAGGIDGYVGQVADNIKDGLNDVNNPDSSYKKDLLADSILYGRYVSGKYVSTSNGAELDSATLCASDYYDLEDAVSISFKFFHNGSAVSMNVVYYDENHSYINGFSGAAVEKQAIPYNARYARFNFFKEELTNIANNDKANHYVYLYYENPKAKVESQLLCGNIVENIVAAGKYKNGYYISVSDGVEQANALLSVSDYIDIHHVDSLTAGFWYSNKTQSHSLCIYDENHNKIAGYAGAEQTISLPSNAYYVRFNLFIAEITGGIDQSKHFLYAYSGQRTPIQLISHTVVAKPLPFDDADLVIFGDSIARGYASNPLGVIDNPWATQFATRANANLNNRAASGTTLAVRSGRSDSIYEKVSAFTGNADIIIVAGGTNDYGSNVPVGTYTDATTNTVYGALNGICNTLKTNYPNVPVIFITPINRSNLVSAEEISYFNSIRNAVYEKATANGYCVIDGVDLGFPDVQGAYQQAMIYDNLHPTVQGHKMYADAVSKILLPSALGGGASAVSDLTDVELTDLTDGDIFQYDTETQKWKNIPSEDCDLINAVLTVDTMPTASEEYEGTAVLFVGTSTANYTKGHIYKCEVDGLSYTWVELVGSSGGGGEYDDLNWVNLTLGNGVSGSAKIRRKGNTVTLVLLDIAGTMDSSGILRIYTEDLASKYWAGTDIESSVTATVNNQMSRVRVRINNSAHRIFAMGAGNGVLKDFTVTVSWVVG